MEGSVDEGNTVEIEHAFVHDRREPYVATLTIAGDSDAGIVEASNSVNVTVVESQGWVVRGYNVEGTSKSAVRVLTTVVRAVVIAGIWVFILSPLWGGALALLFLVNWLSGRGGLRLELSRLLSRWTIQGPWPGSSTGSESEDQVVCSSCGARNSEGVSFCTGCGNPMKDS